MKIPMSGAAKAQTSTLMTMQNTALVSPALRIPFLMRSGWLAP